MQKYTYIVKDQDGKTRKGSINAESRDRVVFALQNKGFIVLEVKEGTALFGRSRKNKTIGGKVRGHILAFFAEQLSTLIAGGVPLVRSLSLLSEYSSSPRLGLVLNQVAKDVAGGNSLHYALSRHPRTFDNIWRSLIQAGEVGGNLADTLEQISAYIKMQDAMRSKIITAITYPAILCVASVGVLIYFILGIVPTFAQIFRDFNIDLPMITKVVLSVSGFLINNGVLLIVSIIVIFIAFRFYIKTVEGRKRWHSFLISMPIFGNFLLNIYYTRMLTTLSTLLRSGVTILNALVVLEDSFNTNVIIQHALHTAKTDVAAGRSISDSFRASGIFPGLMTEMMMMGEESGKLPSIISTLARFYSDNVDQFIARFSAVIDPILIVGVGSLIGIIVASIFLPIFKLSQIGSQ